VGMAIAQAHLAARFNRPGHAIIDHYIYVFASDGDIMEGVSAEAASLAGHLRLGKLIVLYDDNHTTIEGSTPLSFSDDVPARFASQGWHVQHTDGHDIPAVSQAIQAAQDDPRPSLIAARTHMAFGSPNLQDDSRAHGAPLGAEEVALTKQKLGWPAEPPFHIPPEALEHCRTAVARGREWEDDWQSAYETYAAEFPALAKEMQAAFSGELPDGWDSDLRYYSTEDKPLPARKAGGAALNALAAKLPALFGGAADLGPSTNTLLAGESSFSAENPAGRNLHFGVREHAMAAALNGMALYGGLIPYGSTYFVFSDYMRPAIRLAAFMGLHVVYVFTHDSVLVGTDGPTHQPIEHLISLRAMPGLTVIRPGDANEAAAAWKVAVETDGPTALIFSRHNLPVLPGTGPHTPEHLARGAYVLAEAQGGEAQLAILACGSELHLAMEAREILQAEGIPTRVVSMPSWELFERQPEAYRREVLPPQLTRRLAVESGSPLGWRRYAGSQGDVFGIERFGLPADTKEIAEAFKLSGEEVARRGRALLERADEDGE
jgi:transketolase